VRLYRAPWSTNCERVTLALAHKGLEAEDVWIDYADRAPVERVSGQGLVPVLVDDDGTVVADSMTIVAWLEERFPDSPPLYPRDPARRAELDVFVDWFNRVWKGPPNEIDAELSLVQPDSERIAALAGEMRAALDRFEALLTDRPYLLGSELSAADVCAYPFLKYGLGRDPEDDERFHRVLEEHQRVVGDSYPRLAAWIRRVGDFAP
jgi:glutathione S-transferase